MVTVGLVRAVTVKNILLEVDVPVVQLPASVNRTQIESPLVKLDPEYVFELLPTVKLFLLQEYVRLDVFEEEIDLE